MNYFQSRTAILFSLWIMLNGTLIHVVEKDLLGIYPDYELTSTVIVAFLAGVLMLLPSVARRNFQPLLRISAPAKSTENLLNLKTTLVSIAAFLAVALGMHYWEIITPFSLSSALNTLWFGGILFLIISFGVRKKSESRENSHAATKPGNTVDSP